MSAPAFGWALERGAALNLPAADRLVLIYLADMANGEKVCWPSQGTIEHFTGLAPKTVRTSLHRLADIPLIRVETRAGYSSRYHILRDTPVNGAHQPPVKRAHVTPANSAHHPQQNVPTHPGKSKQGGGHNSPVTPVNGAHDPSTTQEKKTLERAGAREPGKILSFGKKQEDAAPPTTPPATPGSDDFNSFLDAPSPAKALPAEIEQEVIHGEVLPPDAPIGPQATGAFVHSLARNFQNNYPPRAPRFSRAEQIDLCQPKPPIRPAYLPDAVLRLARMQLAERAHAP